MLKKDEFYTLYEDINNEIIHYKKELKDKIIYCNCDKPKESNFYFYFINNFFNFEIKKLIFSFYNENGQSYKMEITNNNNQLIQKECKLKGDGDFRSSECIEIIKECDIVITNPPFSLFTEFVELLLKYNKKIIIIGPNNAISYKKIFNHLKNNELYIGYNFNKTLIFKTTSNYDYDIDLTNSIKDGNFYCRVPAITWYTNILIDKHCDLLKCDEKYKIEEYPHYLNYDAIDVKSIKKNTFKI